ncbi:MAG: hypothetical protein M3407_04885, partial [Acidobacteriota bacterium]|nr:hypothetical protein [Acidobacteriota bacterium]
IQSPFGSLLLAPARRLSCFDSIIVMLERLGELVSPGNNDTLHTASASDRSLHSHCNYSGDGRWTMDDGRLGFHLSLSIGDCALNKTQLGNFRPSSIVYHPSSDWRESNQHLTR